MKDDLRQRVGTFSISHTTIEESPKDAVEVLSGCIIIRAESDYHGEVIVYTALHPDFKVLEPGCKPPQYVAKMFMLESRRVVKIGWEEFSHYER